MMMNKIPINIWINEQRYQKLCQAGLENMTEEVLAGMKVLKVYCNEEEKDILLKKYPSAKYDQSTTKSIELLPAEIKNEIFNMVVKEKKLDIFEKYLK
jgi:hypothetical protein